MPYALLDDQYHSNPKVIAMGLDGAGLYSRALSYCADYLTDGLVPLEWATAVVGRKRKILDHLTGVGAWTRVHVRDQIAYTDRTGNEHELNVKVEGFWISDYTMFNPSRIEYEATKKKKSKAGRKGAVTRWGDSNSDNSRHSTSNDSRHPETAENDVENPGGNMAAAMAPATPPARAPAHTPSPTPTQELKAAAVGSTPDPPPTTDAAAADQHLEELLTQLALPDSLRHAAHHEPGRAKAVAEYTIANHGTGAYFRTVFESGDWPTTTANSKNGSTADPADPADRRQRFLKTSGYLLPDDELEYQLRTTYGATDDEIIEALETAHDLRAAA